MDTGERAALSAMPVHWASRAGADPRVLALAVIAGAGLVCFCAEPPPLVWFALALLVCLLRFPGRVAIAALLLAAAWTSFNASQQIDARLPASRSGDVLWLTGRVDGLVSVEPTRSRFVLARDHSGQRFRLAWYDDAPALLPGDCLRVKAKLETPHGLADPGTFDYEAWLWRRHIDATGYVKQAGHCGRPALLTIDRLRARALRRMDAILADAPMRGIVEALTLGARDGITDAQWDILRATGTSHLVAISGLHIGLIATLLFVLARWLALRLPWRLPVFSMAAGVAFTGAFGYALLAGLALPTQRALIMVAAGLLAVSTMREFNASRALALAAIAVVFWAPASVIAPGFWLSFGAVAWLLYFARFARRHSWPTGFGLLQLALVAGLLPATLWFFEQASLVAPLVNGVLIPLAAVLVPLLLVVTMLALTWPALGGPLLVAMARLLDLGWPVLDRIAHWPLASVHVGIPGMPALVLALGGIAILFMPRGLSGRWLGALLMLPALFGWMPSHTNIAHGGYRLTVLDVGQGLSVVVRTRRHTLVFDAGPAYRTGFDTGAAVVVPYLRHVGRTHVDRLVISHADMDHAGGVAAIEHALDVARRLGSGGKPCRAGQHWHWDGVDFRFVYPTDRDAAQAETTNALSCVLRIRGTAAATLLTGDIESGAERRLVARRAADIDVDVLVVAHHGSASSSSPAFVAAASPEYALISSGWDNRWDFPAAAVVARLRSAGARVANTAYDGALLLQMPATTERAISLRRWRVVHTRLWQMRQVP